MILFNVWEFFSPRLKKNVFNGMCFPRLQFHNLKVTWDSVNSTKIKLFFLDPEVHTYNWVKILENTWYCLIPGELK